MTALLVWSGCDTCEEDKGGGVQAVEGVELYEYSLEGAAEIARIYRTKDGRVELVYADRDGRRQDGGRVSAALTAEALEIVEETTDYVVGGGELGSFGVECLTHVDRPKATLSMYTLHAGLEFAYPWECAPQGLRTLDQVCRELVLKLPGCESSSYFEDCQERS